MENTRSFVRGAEQVDGRYDSWVSSRSMFTVLLEGAQGKVESQLPPPASEDET